MLEPLPGERPVSAEQSANPLADQAAEVQALLLRSAAALVVEAEGR